MQGNIPNYLKLSSTNRANIEHLVIYLLWYGGAFMDQELGYLWALDEGRNTAIKYVEILTHVLPDICLELSETLGIDDPIFMQDNSSIHTSTCTPIVQRQ